VYRWATRPFTPDAGDHPVDAVDSDAARARPSVGRLSRRRVRELTWSVSLSALAVAVAVPLTVTAAVAASRGRLAAPVCTLYASPSGSSANTGTTPTATLPLADAIGEAGGGDVVCLTRGVYVLAAELAITDGGTDAGDRLVIRGGIGGTTTLRWANRGRPGTTQNGGVMLRVAAKVGYVTISDLRFDGNDTAYEAVKIDPDAHHIEFSRNTVVDTGASGIASVGADYVTIDRNRFYRTGYGIGWSSAVSLNQQYGAYWYDTYPGFHSFITNNIISGSNDESVHHTEGNAIMVDRGGAIPPVLVANNLVLNNGSRGIANYRVSGDVWIVNNTSYANGVDNRITNGYGEIAANRSSNQHWVNNIAYACCGRPTFQTWLSSVEFTRNVGFGGSGSAGVPAALQRDSARLRSVNPLFVAPPRPLAANGRRVRALAPWLVGNRLSLRPASRLIDAGVNPMTLQGLTPEQRTDMAAVLGRDLAGNTRPWHGRWDIGAYEFHGTR
jgi:Right handed beta helix region